MSSLSLFADKDPNQRVGLREVAQELPGRRPGKRLSYYTVLRWVTRGLRGRRLRTVLIGGLRVTTWRWVEQFLESLNRPCQDNAPATPPVRGKAAARVLDELGV